MLERFIIATAFLLWILPLGVFIKPSDEKKVCGGHRAICLCSHLVKGQGGASKKIVMAHPPGNEKDVSPSGSSGQFLAANFRDINNLLRAKFLQDISHRYSFVVCKSIEHVPKA